MLENNAVARYVFDLDDIRGIAVTLNSAAGALSEAAGSVRAAGRDCAGLPDAGDEVAQICQSLAGKLVAGTAGLRADARWLAGVVTALAATDAAAWTTKKLNTAIHFARDERELRRQLGQRDSHARRGTRITGIGVDLFGEDLTGSKLPGMARSYYRNLTTFKRIDRASWQLRYVVNWYTIKVHDKLKIPPRPKVSKPGWAERIAGNGKGAGRARRLVAYAVPGASAAALVVDVRALKTQQHHGVRGVLEFARDATSTGSSSIHLASDVLLVAGPPGAAADKLVDASVLATLDTAVLTADAIDYVVFEKGDEIVHAAGDAVDAAGDALSAIGGLL
ncbi:hypothetical protein Rhe02_65910 [Rhizocola hellebori]|uniref:Uncharacterized protein n=1 Tax=Rhizocola hellebori TaxID=1392758 RepID=A0A8J3QF17_9ACTN|nr:hypothetical protein [Rhizocola hellebori]GIH08524.1 hypothetical protein Rhe02_65910 [Rhizocola hellebori]